MAAFKPRRSVDRDSTTESPMAGIPTQGPIVKVNFPNIPCTNFKSFYVS